MILTAGEDPRLVTIRRGGSLTDPDHHLLVLWAAACAEHVLYLFEAQAPGAAPARPEGCCVCDPAVPDRFGPR
jgi:hypothetical protein